MRRGSVGRALARVEAKGKPTNHYEFEALTISNANADRARREACPVEQAKTYLRSRGIVVYSATVKGGPATHNYVGAQLLSDPELLARAMSLGWTAKHTLKGE